MNRSFKRIKTFLVIAISLVVLLSSTYFCYYFLASADFVSHGLRFEILDQDYLLAASISRLKVFGPSSFSIISALCVNSIKQIYFFTFLISHFDQRTPILRC
jgi:hypothetical protein